VVTEITTRSMMSKERQIRCPYCQAVIRYRTGSAKWHLKAHILITRCKDRNLD